MTAPVFDLTAARTNTPNWPPMDGDIWTDRNGREWLAVIQPTRDDNTIVVFRSGNAGCLPSYALEMHGPLTLTAKDHARIRFEELPADQQARYMAYLASVCTFCGPEGATGPECTDCANDLEMAA
ncbi:hypothetical protein ACIBCR_14780 [Micromonospora echinospora]|uniref:hypothetical protein n=1 Tax=Micromonospora echinospora TaxID=1877 RepID=UPI0037892897